MLIIPLGLSIFQYPYNLLRILYVIHSRRVFTGICVILSYNTTGHLLTDVVRSLGVATYIVLWSRCLLVGMSFVMIVYMFLFHDPYLIGDSCFYYGQCSAEQLSGHFNDYLFNVFSLVATIVGLHYGVRAYGLPGGLYEVASYQAVRSPAYPGVAQGIATLVDARANAHITGQVLDAPEPAQVPKFTKDAAGHYGAYARYAAQQHVIFFVVPFGVFAKGRGHITELPVYEPEAAHTAAEHFVTCGIFEFQAVQPTPEGMAPMVVVILRWYFHAIIQQLHLDVALDLAHVLDQVVAPPEKTPQLLALGVGDVDALQTAVLEFTGYELGIYPVGLGIFLLAPAEYVRGVHHQGLPTITLETSVGTIAAASRLVGRCHFMSGEMPVHIVFQPFGTGGHRKGPATGNVGGTMNLPAALVDVDANE